MGCGLVGGDEAVDDIPAGRILSWVLHGDGNTFVVVVQPYNTVTRCQRMEQQELGTNIPQTVRKRRARRHKMSIQWYVHESAAMLVL